MGALIVLGVDDVVAVVAETEISQQLGADAISIPDARLSLAPLELPP